ENKVIPGFDTLPAAPPAVAFEDSAPPFPAPVLEMACLPRAAAYRPRWKLRGYYTLLFSRPGLTVSG
ncbi:MAG TPA: hypothetical protein VJ417_10430, partial [Candidatus Glassbacteria bacterium]|nr:hypothetical protein [Candidatus Glassbacteria bacterium]